MAREKAASNVLMRVCIIMYYSTLIYMRVSVYVTTTDNIYIYMLYYKYMMKNATCIKLMYILRIIIFVCIYDTIHVISSGERMTGML